MIRLAVYGTLRKEGSNYDSYLEGLEPLGTVSVPGFRMYSLGAYPAIVETPDNSVVVEVYEVPDETASRVIRMELGAGYTLKEIESEFGQAYVFKMDPRHLWKRNVIPSGDWVKYYNEINLMVIDEGGWNQ